MIDNTWKINKCVPKILYNLKKGLDQFQSNPSLKFTSSSSLSPALSSASDDAILFPPNTVDYVDPNKRDCYCTFPFIRPRKPPVLDQNFSRCSDTKFTTQYREIIRLIDGESGKEYNELV